MPDELLGWALKGLWLEHHALDHGPEAAYLGARGMGERVGLAADTVERYRRELVRLGLLVKLAAPPGATAGWCPVLPEDCVPTEPRLSPAQVIAYRDRLVAHLRGTTIRGSASDGRTVIRRSGGQASGGSPGQPSGGHAALPPDQRPPVSARSARRTPGPSSEGMEVVGEVGEKPPTAVGGVAHATNGERRASQELRPMRELVAEEMRRAAVLRRREAKP